MSKKQHHPDFIRAMKERLEADKGRIQQELSSLDTNFPEYGRHEEDNAAEIADYQASSATESALESRLREINKALDRIERGKYGITEEGELIPEQRLRANPAATTVIRE